MTYIKENKSDFTGCCATNIRHLITKLKKLYSSPRSLRTSNKSPMSFLGKPLHMGDLLPAHKIFIERPVSVAEINTNIIAIGPQDLYNCNRH